MASTAQLAASPPVETEDTEPEFTARDLEEEVTALRKAAALANVRVVELASMDIPFVRLRSEATQLVALAQNLGQGVLYLAFTGNPGGRAGAETAHFAQALADRAAGDADVQGPAQLFRELARVARTVGAPVVTAGFLRQGVMHGHRWIQDDAQEAASMIEAAWDDIAKQDADDPTPIWDMERQEAAEAILDELDSMHLPRDALTRQARKHVDQAARNLVGNITLVGMQRERVHQAVLLAARMVRSI